MIGWNPEAGASAPDANRHTTQTGGVDDKGDKPVVLDLFCRKGGATVGYQRAGFHVIGVDIESQPGYPGDEFWQRDALKVLDQLAHDGWLPTVNFGLITPVLIHTGPPCQGQNTATASNRIRGIEDDHPSLVAPTRELLERIGIPYVIEQPTSSIKDTIRRDITLCMDMFKGELPPPWVQKHRSFELGYWPVKPDQPVHPAGPVRGGSMAGFPKPAGHATRVRGWRHGSFYSGDYVAAYGKGGGKGTLAEVAHAMQIDWMTDLFDLCEAIPPAFTQWLGRQFLASQEACTMRA